MDRRGAPVQDMMNTKEVAEYLRIKERKVYDLVRTRSIPSTRVAGKWLFPKALVDLWILRNARCDPAIEAPLRPGAVIVGSHDPLLEWAARESGCEMALLSGGSLDGLRRFAAGDAAVCGLHVFDAETQSYNAAAVKNTIGDLDVVLIEWAWREQGLIVAKGNPMHLTKMRDLGGRAARFAGRQEAAGSRVLLEYLLAKNGMSVADIKFAVPPALSETDVAIAVSEGKADAGLAIKAVAEQFRLDFVPLHRERYDLAVRRREYFEPGFQHLLDFAGSERFADKARTLGGYDITELGRVIYNGP